MLTIGHRGNPLARRLLTVIISLLMNACAGPAGQTDLPTASGTQPPAATAVETVTPGTAPTRPPTSSPEADSVIPAVTPLADSALSYRDEYAGFYLRYPSDWALIPPREDSKDRAVIYSATFSSWESSIGGMEGIPDGETKLDVIVVKQAADSFEAAIEWRQSQFEHGVGDQEVLSEETWILPSGLRSRRLTIAGGGLVTEELFTVIDGRIVLLSALGDTEIFNRIALTLAPIE